MDNIPILYEDNHILVVVKPQNMPTCADNSKDKDLLETLRAYLQQKYQKERAYIGLVHRLDRPTGGVIVFAKTSKAAARLSAQLQNGDLHKGYLAVLQNKPRQLEGTLTHYLKKNAINNLVYICTQTTDGAKKATLQYKILESLPDGKSLAKIDLFTGRSHQIRVQMLAIDCPLVCDVKYNKQAKKGNLALWAFHLTFLHPITQEKMRFLVQPPENTIFHQFAIDKLFKI